MREIVAKRMISVKCKQCGKEFHQYSKKDSYCSNECRNAADRDFRRAHNAFVTKVCPECMKEFETTRKDKLFCCNACTVAHNTRVQSAKRSVKTKRTCPVCGRGFWSAHQYKMYCGKECYAQSKKKREADKEVTGDIKRFV